MAEGNIHPKYYWNSVAFEVEETIFKVPTARFKQSMWDTTIEPEQLPGVPRGPNDSIRKLDGVTRLDFESLLDAMYPAAEGLHLGVEQWMAVFRLSTKWRILPIRKVALSHLEELSIDPVEAVLLAKECFVDGLLISAYEQLVVGTRRLSRQEGSKLGVECLMDIYEMREFFNEPPELLGEVPEIVYQPIFPWGPPVVHQEEVHTRNNVHAHFEGEFQQLRVECEKYQDIRPHYK
ncbi:hypothetical protein C8J56DRAFT_827077 [Mycena floridula]|nr:hypothetical protein C8J56DRAFT_827077 [Mycena floridula]